MQGFNHRQLVNDICVVQFHNDLSDERDQQSQLSKIANQMDLTPVEHGRFVAIYMTRKASKYMSLIKCL